MPSRGKVAALPVDVRRRLDAMIVEKGFGDYAGAADWLAGEGHPMHKATLARHGRKLRRHTERLRTAAAQARALLAAAPEDSAVIDEAALIQTRAILFEALLEADDATPQELLAVIRAIAGVDRALAAVRKERRDFRGRSPAERREPERGLSVEALRRIREQAYGITEEIPE